MSIDQVDHLLDQDQLRHFLKAAIYPLRSTSKLILETYCSSCLEVYKELIILALNTLTHERQQSFKSLMKEAMAEIMLFSKS
jgi:hypothetical protein